MRVLDLFSGIGGFSLGLERAGMRTVAFCEIEPFCRAVLRKHWPGVPIYEDVRELTAERLRGDGIAVDLICGGFPCQDISLAGRGAGIEGERSGLWKHFARLIGELRPRYIIVENVSALLVRGLGRVLGDLAALGYDAEWHCIPASAVGAPHRRDRIWIVAYTGGQQYEGRCPAFSRTLAEELSRTAADASPLLGPEIVGGEPYRDSAGLGEVADPDRQRQLQPQRGEQEQRGRAGNGSQDVADTEGDGWIARRACDAAQEQGGREFGGGGEREADVADAAGIRRRQVEQHDGGRTEGEGAIREALQRGLNGETAGRWELEPDVGRVAHGVPARVDRLRSLGNAVVPQIPETIGRAIMRLA